jgi:hypothetical protein
MAQRYPNRPMIARTEAPMPRPGLRQDFTCRRWNLQDRLSCPRMAPNLILHRVFRVNGACLLAFSAWMQDDSSTRCMFHAGREPTLRIVPNGLSTLCQRASSKKSVATTLSNLTIVNTGNPDSPGSRFPVKPGNRLEQRIHGTRPSAVHSSEERRLLTCPLPAISVPRTRGR